ncbi:ATP-dependent DNA helicase RecG [Parafilimonas terrae]|uniref:ATP-dependent DNA helicase RecG n=1 Tax=Parafilimonas terrae TaxID=1465490 RepID=A0A1I5TV23_9BACT|nr:ATP-dependent DNA helicase RecG [Parafilimonas terrae]SFP86751.1 ATP-dependent DNA helicase RecG [Parafilimonas terrae]
MLKTYFKIKLLAPVCWLYIHSDICLQTSVINYSSSILSSPIEYLKGVGPLKADLLKKELGIFTFEDLLSHYPLRYIDRTKIDAIAGINPQTEYIQVAGRITGIEILGQRSSKRMVAWLEDGTGMIELTWFQGIHWVQKMLHEGGDYLVYGKVVFFNGRPQITHPEIELFTPELKSGKSFLEPVYSTTEKLKAKGLNARQIARLTSALIPLLSEKDLYENIPGDVLQALNLMPRYEAVINIHFPKSFEIYEQAARRLKFEEFFLAQVRMGMIRGRRHRKSRGVVFEKVGELFNSFYNDYLPFQLTGAQKRVIKEIRADTAKAHQMNRLLQGDVGSGKTIVALLVMLIAADNNYQSCLMAPTEILAQQHFNNIKNLLKDLPAGIALLTGTTKQAERRLILEELKKGNIHILVGTHAVIEDVVQFNNLGLVVIDEQHRFGVAQRAKLWAKAEVPPHVLVMTATPIPRTLAMTAYGDLDYSIINELPPGRQPVITVHRYETKRASVMDFVKTEIKRGRQAFFVYPLIEESEKLSYEDLMQGYEQVKSFFPEHKYSISMVHGKMPAEQKDVNMQRFKSGDTHILVGTTVIEVGIDIPNASVMVIESSEKFGLSQLHQLRGRVGRGSDKSYCILLTPYKLSNDAKERLKIMCATNDGFKIAEKDLELRGPGEIEGTRQSGMLNFKLASLVNDKDLLDASKFYADAVLSADEELIKPENTGLKSFLLSQKGKTVWSKIS